MRLPRLRIPLRLPRLSFEWLGGINRTVVLYTAFTLGLFLIFLVVNFPHDVVVRRVINDLNLGNIQLDFSSARFAWHRGYELSGVRLAPLNDGLPPLLEVSTFDVRPAFADLVRGTLTNWSWDGELYGGTAEGTWMVSNAGGNGHVVLSDLDLARVRLLLAQFDEGKIVGKLSGDLSLQFSTRDARATQLSGELTIARPGLSGVKVKGFTVPDLQFSQAKGKIGFHGDRLDLQELKLTGDQLNAQVSGQITFKEPVSASTLNLRATIEPSAATPDTLKALLAMIPRPANAKPDTPLTISGTFAAPQFR